MESVTDGRTDRQTDGRRTKWSLCVAMLHRRHKNIINSAVLLQKYYRMEWYDNLMISHIKFLCILNQFHHPIDNVIIKFDWVNQVLRVCFNRNGTKEIVRIDIVWKTRNWEIVKLHGFPRPSTEFHNFLWLPNFPILFQTGDQISWLAIILTYIPIWLWIKWKVKVTV